MMKKKNFAPFATVGICLLFWLVVALLLMHGAGAEALSEPAQVARWGVDWTPLVVALIGVLSGLIGRIWAKYVRPWLERKGLTDAAQVVVDAVEAIIGRGNGSAKWTLALEKMAEKGFDIDSTAVLDALRAAWLALDLQQVAVGAKEPEKPPDTTK